MSNRTAAPAYTVGERVTWFRPAAEGRVEHPGCVVVTVSRRRLTLRVIWPSGGVTINRVSATDVRREGT